MHTGVGVALFIRDDSGFYANQNSKVTLTMEDNTFVNQTGDDTYCAYQIIETWTGSLDENSVVPTFNEDNIFQ